MLTVLREQLKQSIHSSLKSIVSPPSDIPPIELDIPNEKTHGELACPIALRLAKTLKKNPIEIAETITQALKPAIESGPLSQSIDRIEIKKPGFINFFFTNGILYKVVDQVLKEGKDYGRADVGRKEKIQIEFVSANPTGPLSVAHARQAAVGDSLARILNFIGFDAKKEFYVNDEGNQINLLGESILCRAREILGESVTLPEQGYQGAYVKDMARELLAQHKIKTKDQINKIDVAACAEFGTEILMEVIKKDLKDFDVSFDIWSHQSKVANPKAIEDVLKFLRDKDFLYEKDGALWFKSTAFGDDKDRVVKKSDGAFTYLTPDIAYHRDKFKRGFKRIINIWGPDHHGYIPRLKAAVAALGHKPDDLIVLIVQLATIYRGGKPLSMSTRRGEFISLRDVLNEVGAEAARFFFLMRHINVHLDFDLELAKKETPENPVFYIQYAHARVNSVKIKAREEGVKEAKEVSQLKEEEERDLIKMLGLFPQILVICYNQMDPYALVSFLHDLAGAFHRFYDKHRIVDQENPKLSAERLTLVAATQVVLANGLNLLGISAPERM